jgi:hypothetical protein
VTKNVGERLRPHVVVEPKTVPGATLEVGHDAMLAELKWRFESSHEP